MDLNDSNLEIYAAKYYRSESCLSKEEFLSQSLKECSSRPIQDIDES